MEDNSQNRFRRVPYSEAGLRHVLRSIFQDRTLNLSQAEMDARVWLEAYDNAPEEEGFAGNVPNSFFVGLQKGRLVFMRGKAEALSVDRALELAVWLSVLADPLDEKFSVMRRAAMDT